MTLILSSNGKIMTHNGKLFVDTNGTYCCCGLSDCCSELLDMDSVKLTVSCTSGSLTFSDEYTLTKLNNNVPLTWGGHSSEGQTIVGDLVFYCEGDNFYLSLTQGGPNQDACFNDQPGLFTEAHGESCCPLDVTFDLQVAECCDDPTVRVESIGDC